MMCESSELLLTWVSERAEGSWDSFRDAHDWVFAKAGGHRPGRAARTLAQLGYLEIDWSARRWSAAPPVLTVVPDAGGHALLTGARPRALVQRLEEETSETATQDLILLRHAQADAPDALFLAAESEMELEALGTKLGIRYESGVAGRLARMLPPLESVLASSQSTPGARGFEVERFAAGGDLGWEPASSDTPPGLYRYAVWGRPLYRFVNADGSHFAPSYALGIYAELRRLGRNVLRYEPDAVNGTLVVPSAAPLPDLQARAAVLCSGLAPAERPGTRVHGYANVPAEVAGRIADSLGQRRPVTVLDGREP